MSFSVNILGYNSAIPKINSHPTAQLINVNERYLLIDCGEGTQVQLRRAQVKFSKINHIFISHLHGDHVFGLIGFISTLQLLGKTTPIHIFGPEGIQDFILNQFKHTQTKSSFEINFHELNHTDSRLIFEDNKIEVYNIPLAHRIYCNGYLIKEKKKLKNLNIEAIQQYEDIERCDYYNLKKGKDFVRENGEIISNEVLTFPAPKPKSYAFCSDTKYNEQLIPIIENVNLLYHETTFMHDLKDLALKTGHSTALEAATIAKKANVGKLIIGHFSNRYPDPSVLVAEARSVFQETYPPELLQPVIID
ncbi:ribonuclease Z [Flavobacteriaceae bacterium Ap0902]|nr:ribonuclease Z [Flavobacteriaceae bacterium Ap0902]